MKFYVELWSGGFKYLTKHHLNDHNLNHQHFEY